MAHEDTNGAGRNLERHTDRLLALQDKIGYHFQDQKLLQTALTHSSFYAAGNTAAKGVPVERECTGDMQSKKSECSLNQDNERLEFLGDAVLELCVTDYLFRQFSDQDEMDEGKMSRIRSMAVCEDALYRAAQNLNVGECLYVSAGEENTGGREKPSILSDALEAIIGATYLDGGFGAAQRLVDGFAPGAIQSALTGAQTDSKTRLQEWLQRDGSVSIQYEVLREIGPAHEKIFVVGVSVSGKQMGEGEGKSKKEAEQKAALNALSSLGVR